MSIKQELIDNVGLTEGNFDCSPFHSDLYVENLEGVLEYLKENYEFFKNVVVIDSDWIELPFENEVYWQRASRGER